MAACDFTLIHSGSPDALYPIAKEAIEAQGGSLHGRPSGGEVTMPTPAGDVSFNYGAVGKRVDVIVTNKPFLVSCARIQSELANILAMVPQEVIDAEGEVVDPLDMPPGYVPPRPRDTRTEAGWGTPEVTEYFYEDDVVMGRRGAVVPGAQRAWWPLLLGIGVIGGVVWYTQREGAGVMARD